jgi:hypothetical protein
MLSGSTSAEGKTMLADPIFSLAAASPEQIVSFIGFAAFTIGFFIWVAYLVRMK